MNYLEKVILRLEKGTLANLHGMTARPNCLPLIGLDVTDFDSEAYERGISSSFQNGT